MSIPERRCSICGQPGIVRESRLCTNGTRRRRIQCTSDHWWTEWDGPRAPRGGPLASRGNLQPLHRLREDQILHILTDPASNAAMGRTYGRSAEAISKIRYGKTYAHVLPALPRRRRRDPEGVTCLQCRHWTSHCHLGFPEPKEEGVACAQDCSSFLAARQQKTQP